MKKSIGKIFTVLARFFVVTCLLAVLCLSQTGIAGAATLVKRIDDRDPAITYSGIWKNTSSPAYYLSTGKYSYATTTNSYCQFAFYGASIRWYGVKATDHGKADVYIDGVLDKIVDCYYSGVWTANTLLYARTGLAPGPHTIKIVVRSDRNPSATESYIEIDAFEFECAEVPPMLCWEGVPSNVMLEPSGVVHTQSSSDSYISFGNTIGQFGVSDFTVALWFKTNDQSGIISVIGNRAEISHGNFFCIGMIGAYQSEPPGKLWVEVDQDSAGANYIWISSREVGLNDGIWHHIVVTRQGVTLKLYVDGNLSAQGSASGIANIANGNPLRTGLPGVISPDARYCDLRIYDLALTDEQVNSVFAIKPPQ